MQMFKAYKLFWQNYFNFKSLSNRSTYWWSFMWNWLIRAILLIWGLITILKTGNKMNLGIILFAVYCLIALIPSISLTARRYQDIGISKYWMLFTYLLMYIIYPIIREMNPTTPIMNLLQNMGAFLIFICATIAVIIPTLPSKPRKR